MEMPMIAMKAGPGCQTMGDILHSLGGISADRVHLIPTPGTAKVRDAVRLLDRLDKRICELIDGTLVEKIARIMESCVAVEVVARIALWNEAAGDVGMILGADALFHLGHKQVRIPDASFTNWDRLPGRMVPADSVEGVPDVVPDLAVEVLNEGNTVGEMTRKLADYFEAEIKLVWYVDPIKRTVRVYTSQDDVTELTVADTLDGGDVLPGFFVSVARIFADLPDVPAKPVKPTEPAKAAKPKGKKKS